MFLTSLIAAGVATTPLPAAALLDRDCFRLMAELTESDDPQLRDLGRVGAQYFLGRIDSFGVDLDVAADSTDADQETGVPHELIGRCTDRMGAAGHDFRRLADQLLPTTPST